MIYSRRTKGGRIQACTAEDDGSVSDGTGKVYSLTCYHTRSTQAAYEIGGMQRFRMRRRAGLAALVALLIITALYASTSRSSTKIHSNAEDLARTNPSHDLVLCVLALG